MSEKYENPYVGPNPFPLEKGELFFGREREAHDLLALVVSEQLVLFYAQSGAGKSSLINTRLIPKLQAKNFEVLHVGRVTGADIISGLDAENIYMANLIRSLVQQDIEPSQLSKLCLSDFLAGLDRDENGYFYRTPGSDTKSRNQPRALIIDQFEELFSMYPEAWNKRTDFFTQLAQAMRDDPYLWVVLVMREDYIANLDPYARYVPGRLRTRYYMQRLETEHAIEAVEGPANVRNRPYAKGAATTLVMALSKVNVRGPDNTWEAKEGQYVEPVQLQVVCSNLWETLSPEETEISNERVIAQVRDLNLALGKFYEDRVREVAKGKKAQKKGVNERQIRNWFEKELIIEGKRRNMVAQEPGGKSGGLDDEVVREFLGSIVREEKRGGEATFYELTHDSMVEPVIDSNRIWDTKNSSPFRSQADEWERKGRKGSDSLITDQALFSAEQWAEANPDKLTDSERAYLEVSRERQAAKEAEELRLRNEQARELEIAQKIAEEQARSARRAQLFNVVAGVLLLIAVIAAVIAYNQKIEADEQAGKASEQTQAARIAKIKAERNAIRAQRLADAAASVQLYFSSLDSAKSRLDLAILLGLQADAMYPNYRTKNNLLALLQKSNRFIGSLPGGEDIQEIQYSPDGKVFATRDENGITLWDAASRQKLNSTPINEHFRGITALAVSKDGKLVASGATDGTIVLWDALKWVPLGKPYKAHNGSISSLTFNNDGSLLASASLSELPIRLWDVSTPSNIQKSGAPLQGHTQSILKLTFSPVGETLASASYDGSIILWDIKNRKQLGKPLNKHSYSVRDLAFDSTGKLLASVGEDTQVFLWDVNDPKNVGEPTQLFAPESYSSRFSVAINRDNKLLAVGNQDGTIDLWNISDPETPEPQGRISPSGSSAVLNLSFNPQDDTLFSSNSYGGAVTIWDIRNPENPKSLGRLQNLLNSTASNVVFLDNGKTAVIGSSDSTITPWDVTRPGNAKIIGVPLQGHPSQPFEGMQFSPDGKWLTSPGEDGKILIDVATQEAVGPGDFVSSPDGSLLAYELVDRTTGETILHLSDEPSDGSGSSPIGQYPVISPDNKTLAYQTYDRNGISELHIRDLEIGDQEKSFPAASNPTFSPNGRILIFSTTELGQSSLNVWDIDRQGMIAEKMEGAYSPRFSPDSLNLAYQTTHPTTYQTLINVLDTSTGQTIVKDLPGNFGGFGSDGGTLIYQSYDSTTGETLINFQDLRNAKEIPGIVGSLQALSSNGEILIYSITEEAGQSINVQKTSTQGSIFTLPGVIFNGFREEGSTLVLLLSKEGENSFVVFNTSTGEKISDQIPGTYLNLLSDKGLLVYQPRGKEATSTNLFDLSKHTSLAEPIPGGYLAISEDGRTLLTRSSTNDVILWDVTKTWPLGEPITSESDDVSSASLSLDGKTLVWIEPAGILAEKENKFQGPFLDHISDFPGTFSAFSPNGSMLAVGDYSTNITTLWDMKTKQQIGDEFTGFYPSFSPDGKLLALGSNNYTSTIWDVNTKTPTSNPFPGYFPSFSPDGKTIAIGNVSAGSTVIWDVDTEEKVGNEFSGIIPAFSPDGSMLAIGENSINGAIIWDVSTQKQVGSEFTGGVFPNFSPDGKVLAVGDYGPNTIKLWDVETHKQVGDEFSGSSASFSPDGKLLAAGSESERVMTLWEIDGKGEKIESVQRPAPGTSMVLSRNGEILASYDPADGIILRNLKTGVVTPLSVKDETESQAADNMIFYDKDTRVATLGRNESGTLDGTLITWDIESGKSAVLDIPDFSENLPEVVSFSPDDKYLVYPDTNGALKIWEVGQKDSFGGMEGSIDLKSDSSKRIAFNPDGTVMAFSDGNRLSIYEFPKLIQIGSDLILDSSVDGLGILMDDENIKYILVRDNAGSTQIWDWETQTKIGDPMPGTLKFIGSNTEAGIFFYIDPSGKLIRFAWNPDNETWKSLLCPRAGRDLTAEEWDRYVGVERHGEVICSGEMIKE